MDRQKVIDIRARMNTNEMWNYNVNSIVYDHIYAHTFRKKTVRKLLTSYRKQEI